MSDWTGDSNSVYVTVGASNHSREERQEDDFYATDPKAMRLLLLEETFSNNVWECACGAGRLSRVLKGKGYNVKSTDLRDRGYGEPGVNFLTCRDMYDGDIITNPPYKYALEFVKHALWCVKDGAKVAMFLRLQFLEGAERKKFFEQHPPETIYIAGKRLNCAKNGDFAKVTGSAIAYAWFVWRKGYTGNPVVKWIN